jgi:hypothetical protein
MNWHDHLVTSYLHVCKHYQNKLWVYSQQMTNYADLSFFDEEVITLYLFSIIGKIREPGNRLVCTAKLIMNGGFPPIV